MKFFIFVLATLIGCSTAEKSYHARHIASLESPTQLDEKVSVLTTGIYHGYLIGQTFLEEFDRELEVRPHEVLKSDAYMSLMAVRAHVEEFEHELKDLYDTLLSASLKESGDKKENALLGIKKIQDFFNGHGITENLRPLVLTNFLAKQNKLQSPVRNKSLVNFKVNQDIFKKVLSEEQNKDSFKDLEEKIKELAQEFKSQASEKGRGTSSSNIVPSAGTNGNISGREFPARTWSLTYDDGPGATTTGQILTHLKNKKIPATFFVLAKQVEAYPAIAKSLKDAGMDMASHSYTHAQLTKVGASQLEREIGTSKKVINEKLGVDVKLFRLPYGAGVSNSNIRSKIAQHKMIHVFWNVDTLDWQDKNPNTIYARAVRQMKASAKNAGIILFHDIHSQSVTASARLMDYLNQEKLTVCTVQGVVNQLNNNLSSCK